jgi:CRISPR-associated endoribonuclease Cas6
LRQHIYFLPEDGQALTLPIHYNNIVQAMIYKLLDDTTAHFLHNKGFMHGKRTFKMFAFSRLMGRYSIDKSEGDITFIGPVSLVVTSPYSDFCSSLANGLLLQSSIRLGSAELQVTNISLERDIIDNEKIKICTLSPIVVYSTLLRPDGRRYTCYFEPGEKDFDEIMEGNLRKKYKAFYDTGAPDGNVTITPLRQPRLSIIDYKDTTIKGYSGEFILSGPTPLLQIAVESGLGSKNSQGFGCIKVIK